MRTTHDSATVRLYFLDEGDGGAQTLMYGPLAEALDVARSQSAEVQEGLYLATDNDVIAFLDLEEGA